MTAEHIIPEQIGGKLSARFLCKPCNDHLGHGVEPAVKKDPSIRLAVEYLKVQLPKQILEGLTYVGTGESGMVRGKVKGGEFRVDAG